jgi:serine/threonine protein kinase/tetratricopeptide (TPR) repeat protein
MAAPQPSPDRNNESHEFASGRFVITGQIGRGGMGEVFRAEDTRLKRLVALKRLPADVRSDPAYRARLMEEAERASALNCPNIAGLYDVVEDGDEVCLVMEYVEGSNLRQRLHQPMPLLTFVEVALQCTEALIAAHDRGIVHRDIKPENIMLTPSGRVKVLDFGLARRLDAEPKKPPPAPGEETVSTVETVGGTVGYMSPEALLSRTIDARSDVFSLGVVFYEALTGRHPFRDATFMATADRILHAEPPKISSINPQVPQSLELVIERMIAKSAEDRYANVHELRTALWSIQQQLASGEWHPPLLTARSKRVLWASAVLVVALATVSLSPWALKEWSAAKAAALPDQKRVAVLPFRSIGGDVESQAYSNGLTETLTTRLVDLTSSRPLDVVSALEVHSKGIRDVDQARKELGANLVLEGSVQRAGPEVRVNFALLDAKTHRQLRAQTLTSALQAGFSFEDQVADTVAKMLEAEVKPSAHASTDTGSNAEARELYLKGRGFLQDFNKPRNLDRAVAALDASIKADSKFAPAYAALGTAYWYRYYDSHDLTFVEHAREACGQAIALDGWLSEAHECLGRLYNGTGQYENAITELQRALTANAKNDAAIRLLAQSYESLGRQADAEQTYLKALQLRPNYWLGYSALGGLYFRTARYEDAARMFQKTIDISPDSGRAYLNLAGVKIEQKKYDDALKLLEKSITLEPSAAAYSNRATVQFYRKDYGKAADDYLKAISLGGEDYELWGNLAEAYYWSPIHKPQAPEAYAHAIRLVGDTIKLNPRDASLRATLAKFYAMRGDHAKAQSELAASLKIAPKDPKTFFVAAVVEQQAGSKASAVSWLDKAVRAGYSPASVEDDPVFASLHEDPAFKKIVSRR